MFSCSVSSTSLPAQHYISTAVMMSLCRPSDRTGFQVWMMALGHCSLLANHSKRLVWSNHIVLYVNNCMWKERFLLLVCWFPNWVVKVNHEGSRQTCWAVEYLNTGATDAIVGREGWEAATVNGQHVFRSAHMTLTLGLRCKKWSGHVHTHNKMWRYIYFHSTWLQAWDSCLNLRPTVMCAGTDLPVSKMCLTNKQKINFN